MKLALISCCKSKLDHRAPARELYTSRIFRARLRLSLLTCDSVLVLSSLHGVVGLNDVLSPYDHRLKDTAVRRSREMQRRFYLGLDQRGVLRRGATFVFHAGLAYYEPVLLSLVRDRGVISECPTAGLNSLATFSELKKLLALASR